MINEIGLKEKQITVIIKEPEQDARIEMLFDNSLREFQKVVGGNIEAVTFDTYADDCTVICNEEGRLHHMKYNFTYQGTSFVGTCIFVNTSGEEFCSLNSMQIRKLMRLYGGRGK